MSDLYTDHDPEYRATRVKSGIPPPSTRDQRRMRQRYTPYNNQSRPQRQAPPQPPPTPLKQADFRTSTDFLSCPSRYTIEELENTIGVQNQRTASLEDILSSKSLIDKMNQLRSRIRTVPKEQLSPAKSKANPFERIGTSIFMNRAATKLAALDATFGLTATDKEFRFVDVCGGPGGFSEYLIWRVQSWGGDARGYGITLKANEQVNWRMERFQGRLTAVEGDLYNKHEIKSFQDRVMNGTGVGVDLVVADGGFDFSGQEQDQEIVTQRLILCEIVTMLGCLKPGGHFVCKFFDMVNEGTAGLVWLLYQLFDEICITKPLSSRPANSERYIVCRGLVYHYPERLLSKLEAWIDKEDTMGIVPRQVFEKDEDFVDYIKMRNMKFAMKQTEALEHLNEFLKNPQLSSMYDQEQIKRRALNEWRLPLH